MLPEIFQNVLQGSTLAQITLPKEIQSVLDGVLSVLQLILTFLVAYLVVLWLTLCFWTFRDVQARTRDIFAQISATALVLFFNIPGILIYRLVRPKETLAEAYERSLQEEYMLQDLEERDICPVCRVKVQPEFNFCFNCRTRLRRECSACGYAIKMKWTNCPNCGTPTKTRAREVVGTAGLSAGSRPVQPTGPLVPRPAPTTREIVPTSETDSLYSPPAAPFQQPNTARARQNNSTGSARPRNTSETEAADAGRNPSLTEQTEQASYYPEQVNPTNSNTHSTRINQPDHSTRPRPSINEADQDRT